MEKQRKVRIEWQNGEQMVHKVWRYDNENLDVYSRDRVERELADLFPLLKCKGLRFNLSYEDSLVGTVTIDSDSDMKSALLAFTEEESLTFRTIRVSECIKPDVEAQCSKLQDEPPPKKKRKVQCTS